MKQVVPIAIVLILSGTPLLAQRTGRTPPPPPDSSITRRAPEGLLLEFIDQDVSIVLRAIAEAGGLNVTLSNMPSTRVSVRLQQAMNSETAIDAMRAVAEGSGITLTEGSAVIRLVGPVQPTPADARTAARGGSDAPERELNLFTVRLKHSNAAVIAPMLMNVLSGTGSVSATTRRGTETAGRTLQDLQRRGNLAPRDAGNASSTTTGVSIMTPGGVVAVPPAESAVAQAIGQTLLSFQVARAGGPLAFSDIRIVPDETTNSLIVRATNEDFLALQQLIVSVDLRPLQVLIEVTIAQVDRNSDLNLGISGAATRKSGANSGDTLGFLPSVSTARDFVALLTGGRGSVNYDLALNALQSRGTVRVLALPILIAQNNKEAVLNVGSSVPFVQITQAGGFDPNARVQTIQYQRVGKELTITPTINSDGYVNMDVLQTNDDVTNGLLFDAPIINERQAQTSVFVRDGQTTVIGGLSDNTTEETTSGIPFLNRLPLIGWMFGSTRRSNKTTELFLFLTPHIVSSDEDLDRLRESVRGSSELLKGVPIEGRLNPRADTLQVVRPGSVRTPVPPV